MEQHQVEQASEGDSHEAPQRQPGDDHGSATAKKARAAERGARFQSSGQDADEEDNTINEAAETGQDGQQPRV